jgi:hypothetical protein
MNWERYVARMHTKLRSECKGSLGRFRDRWENNIDLGKI